MVHVMTQNILESMEWILTSGGRKYLFSIWAAKFAQEFRTLCKNNSVIGKVLGMHAF